MNLLLNFPGREAVTLSMSSYCKENLNWFSRTYCSKAIRVEMFYILTTFFFFGGKGRVKGEIKHY